MRLPLCPSIVVALPSIWDRKQTGKTSKPEVRMRIRLLNYFAIQSYPRLGGAR